MFDTILSKLSLSNSLESAKYLFLGVCTTALVIGASQLVLVQASQLPANPGNPGSQLPANPGSSAPATGAPTEPQPFNHGDTNIPPQAPQVSCPDISAPTGLSVNVGAGTISWGNPGGAVSYKWRLDDLSTPGLTCNSNGDGCSEDYRTTSMTWNFIPGHNYHFWVHAISDHCDSDANNTNFSVSVPAQPTATPVPTSTPVGTITPPSGLNASCPGGTTATLAWSAAFKGNASASNYTLRLNKEPFGDWIGPGDQIFQAGTNLRYDITQLTPGNYGFSVQAGFLDGSTSNQVLGNQFTCQVAGVTPTATPTPTPAPSGAAAIANCQPGQVVTMTNSQLTCVSVANANNNSNTNTVTVNNTNNPAQPGSVLAAAPAAGAQVAGVATVNTLPKTGLPIAAWLLSGLLPIGAGLKKFAGSGFEEADDSTPTYLWQKRRFMKG